MGPVGSGKSVACCWEIFMRAQAQAPAPDGKRRSRWLVVRNTLPQLETTTMRTWKDWFPEEIFGTISGKPPYTQVLKYNDVEMEVIFMALDRPDDVNKLKSLEVTGIWVNEAKYVPKEIIDTCTERVGRYPKRSNGGPTWYGVIMDTNAPDEGSWWYDCAEGETPKGWKFWSQPSGMSPEAENAENLPPGYYEKMCAGKTTEWVNVNVHGKYGFVLDGKLVYGSSFNGDVHVSKVPLKFSGMLPTYVGLDASGRSPAAVFLQKTPRGQWMVLHEFCAEDMGSVQFAQLLKAEIAAWIPSGSQVWYYGDPAGSFKTQADEKTYFDVLRGEAGILVRPAMDALRIGPRVDAVISVLMRMIDGQPGIIVDPSCKRLIRGFNGKYRYRKLNVSGDPRYMPEPEKNDVSHPHDALQYALAGGGEIRATRGVPLGRGGDLRAKDTVGTF